MIQTSSGRVFVLLPPIFSPLVSSGHYWFYIIFVTGIHPYWFLVYFQEFIVEDFIPLESLSKTPGLFMYLSGRYWSQLPMYNWWICWRWPALGSAKWWWIDRCRRALLYWWRWWYSSYWSFSGLVSVVPMFLEWDPAVLIVN